MKIFLDTSAFFAILDKDDANHQKAKKSWDNLLNAEDSIPFTTNYIVVESSALIQHRLGSDAVRAFHEVILPLINIAWVDAETHRAGTGAFLLASRRKLSLVDCISFEVMRTDGVKSAFTFDAHFSEQGFRRIP